MAKATQYILSLHTQLPLPQYRCTAKASYLGACAPSAYITLSEFRYVHWQKLHWDDSQDPLQPIDLRRDLQWLVSERFRFFVALRAYYNGVALSESQSTFDMLTYIESKVTAKEENRQNCTIHKVFGSS